MKRNRPIGDASTPATRCASRSAFAVLFTAVFIVLRWSGDAVRFGASRVAARGVVTWHVVGVVRNSTTLEPIPWASIDDDTAGRPPFFHAEAGQYGAFDLLTLAEPHQIIISATRYHNRTVNVGRVWFLWMPSGKEMHDVFLAHRETP